jgi:hypothetical protein
MTVDLALVMAASPAADPAAAADPADARVAGHAADAHDAVTVDAIPASPPPEVWDAMAVAHAAGDRLATSGRGLSFRTDERTRRLVIELHDVHGNVLDTLSPSGALDIAAGKNPTP